MADSNPAILGGTLLPNVLELSPCVGVALGQNPSMFTGPGTNTYLVGTGKKRLLLDTGSGLEAYMPVLEEALARVGCDGLEGIVLTHAHPDHIGGVDQVRAHFGELPVYKRPWPSETGLSGPGGGVSPISVSEPDRQAHCKLEHIDHGDVVETEGARLRAVYTPGHAPDHLCFVLEEEQNLFSGDNVLGIGTTVIPGGSGDLGDYMDSLDRLLAEAPRQMPMLLLLAVAPDGGAATQNLNPLQKLLGGGGMMTPMLLIFVVFYFMLIRPQQKKQKEHEEWQKKVGPGDEVVTTGGLLGKVTHVANDILTVEVGDKVRVRVLRSHVSGAAPGTRPADKDTTKASA